MFDFEEELGSRYQFWISDYQETRKIQALSILIICTYKVGSLYESRYTIVKEAVSTQK